MDQDRGLVCAVRRYSPSRRSDQKNVRQLLDVTQRVG
jgi:hypothetical protein